MRAITAPYIFDGFDYQLNKAVVFDDKIIDIIDIDRLEINYSNIDIIEYKSSIIYPGFINPHIHLEFSSNISTLKYGDFMEWLHSVIENRDELLNSADDNIMYQACIDMLKSGITTFGAVSSYGLELEVCKKAPQRVIFFNEAIGSIPSAVDALYNDFLQRVDNSIKADPKDKITPAIAIHSPYSVHPILLKRVIQKAKENNMPLSTHFMESPYEREWLEYNSGEFARFFKEKFGVTKAVTTPKEFIEAFDSYPTLFVHAIHLKEEEYQHLALNNHSIIHCPRSNRLLGCGRLNLSKCNNIPISIATDGLSSNWSLNIFDELREALMMHYNQDLDKFAKELLKGITSTPSKALKSNTGEIIKGALADFAVVSLPHLPKDISQLAIQTILHTKDVKSVWIDGEEII